MKHFIANDLSTICLKRSAKRCRASSYDRNGGNEDRVYLEPGETFEFARMEQPGCIRHIWITLANEGFELERNCFRKTLLRFYWDGKDYPSVEAPIGDFFGMGHGISKNFVSAPLQMSPEDGKGFNCWWPMPYRSARLTVTNECKTKLVFYYYVDYEEYPEADEDLCYFHAAWRRECPTKGVDESKFANHNAWCFEESNLSGEENYLVLHTRGKGHYCGCNVNIHNLSTSGLWDWPGEGDDMIFIDGDTEPTLNGTGTEDYVNMAWCPMQEYSAPYHGLILGGRDNWKGKITYYRYHIADPIMFEKEIKVTIEHGHCNHRSDDWSTTAYWYQTEPAKIEWEMLPVEERLPVDEEILRRENRIVKEKL